jgi:hypothetical protein
MEAAAERELIMNQIQGAVNDLVPQLGHNLKLVTFELFEILALVPGWQFFQGTGRVAARPGCFSTRAEISVARIRLSHRLPARPKCWARTMAMGIRFFAEEQPALQIRMSRLVTDCSSCGRTVRARKSKWADSRKK